MNRRKFIVLTSTGVVAIGAASLYFNVFNSNENVAALYPENLAYIVDFSELVALGDLYLSKNENEKDLDQISKLLNFEDGIESAVLENKILNDYKNDATIVLDGWILSLTEARQCAFLSLTHKKR